MKYFTSPLVAIFTCLAIVLSGTEAKAQRRFVNESGKPLALMKLLDSKGIHFATLYMTGKEMVIDAFKNPVKGAGAYEAVSNNYYNIFFITFSIPGGEQMFGLHVRRVEWDDTGKTVSIDILDPYLECKEKIRIVSDIKQPKLHDGLLYLRLEGNPTTEFAFDIRFGKGQSVKSSKND